MPTHHHFQSNHSRHAIFSRSTTELPELYIFTSIGIKMGQKEKRLQKETKILELLIQELHSYRILTIVLWDLVSYDLNAKQCKPWSNCSF